MFVNTFAVTAFLNLKSIAITYLLVKDYAVPQAQAGQIAGRVGLVGTFFVLPSEFAIGTLSDITGRKKLIVAGYLILGAAMVAMT